MSSPAEIQQALEAGRAAGLAATGGANADYIPFLASVPSSLFGLAIATADGRSSRPVTPITPSRSSPFPRSSHWR